MNNKDIYLHKNETQDNYTTEKINVICNGLLGEYIEGNYVIPSVIADELLDLPKYKKSTFKNSVFVTSFLPTHGELVFELIYEKNTSNNTAKATIYVLENEYKVNGYLQNTVKTKLKSYIDDLDGFIEKSYEKFKISVNEGDSKTYKITDDPNLQGYVSAKKQFSNALNQLTEDKYLNLYKSFFEQRLTLLKELNNPFTKSVLDKFNLEYQKIEKFFLQNKDYKALSELLDKCFEDMYGVNPNFKDQEKEYREKILPMILIFSQQAETLVQKSTPKAISMLNKPDKEKVEQIKEEVKKVEEKAKSEEKVVEPKTPAKQPEKAKEKPQAEIKSEKSSDSTVKNIAKDLEHLRKTINEAKAKTAEPSASKKEPVSPITTIKDFTIHEHENPIKKEAQQKEVDDKFGQLLQHLKEKPEPPKQESPRQETPKTPVDRPRENVVREQAGKGGIDTGKDIEFTMG